MNEIKFNWLSYNADFNDPKGGTKMKVDCYSDILKQNDNDKIRIQLFDCGYRVTKDTLDYSNWNQCIYKDIDYKHYYNNNQILSPDILYNQLVTKLIELEPNCFSDAEISRSGIDFHLFFGFDCNRTIDNRNFYNEYVNKIIIRAFTELGYKDIIEYPKVFDTCTDSVYQLCYITKKNWIHNYRFTGKIGIKPPNDYNTGKNKNEKNNNIISSDIDIYYYGKIPIKGYIDYIEHVSRWRLFNSLSRIFQDPLKLKEEWEYCCEHIPEENGHTLNWYKVQPYSNDWSRKLNGNEYIDKDLLKDFGYEVYIKKKLSFSLNFQNNLLL